MGVAAVVVVGSRRWTSRRRRSRRNRSEGRSRGRVVRVVQVVLYQ